MENASKALLMAAGVLISILILTLAMYLIVNFGSFSAEVHKRKEENELQRFNAQFLSYQGIETVTMHDIVTIVNYAKDNNEKYEATNGNDSYYLCVKLDGTPIEMFTQKQLDGKIKETMQTMVEKKSELQGNMPRYNCEVQISDETGRVNLVLFSTP